MTTFETKPSAPVFRPLSPGAEPRPAPPAGRRRHRSGFHLESSSLSLAPGACGRERIAPGRRAVQVLHRLLHSGARNPPPVGVGLSIVAWCGRRRARYLEWTLSPPLDTGFPSADAQDDFLRVRRRQVMSRLARRVGREPGDVDVILPYDEVVAALGYLEESYVGLKTVPLDSILGTVDRAKGFDRQFRPTTARVRARWERIANAVRRGEPMPPISLFQIGEVYFVRDGHHRVSVARALGRTDIDAYVVEVRTRVGRRPHAARRRPAQEEPRARLLRARAAAQPRARADRRDRRVGLRRAGRRRGGVGLPAHAGPRRVPGPRRPPRGCGSTRSTSPSSRCCARPTCSATGPRPTPICACPRSAIA